MMPWAVTEQRPAHCPTGHPFVAGHMIVGWEPCHCTAGHTGHRTYWCEFCGALVEVPPCVRGGVATPDRLGLARPGWSGHSTRAGRPGDGAGSA